MSDDIVDKGALVRAGRMASGEFYVELDGKRLVREDGELITSLRAEVARLEKDNAQLIAHFGSLPPLPETKL